MNCNDLMLGDLVQGHLPNTPSKVVGIPNEYRLAVITPGGAYMELSIDDFLPIPITTEILEKNGFINGEFYAESHIEDWQIMSDGSHLAARSDRGWCIDIPCRYVHQLQHALRLCGIEKEIVL